MVLAVKDYTRTRATATRLIAKFGTTVTIIRRGAATGPEYNPTFGPDTEHPLRGVILDYSAYERAGTLIGATDHKVLVAASGVVPTQADKVRIGSQVLEIFNVKATEPAGVPVMYEMQCRG